MPVENVAENGFGLQNKIAKLHECLFKFFVVLYNRYDHKMFFLFRHRFYLVQQ